MKKHRSTTRQQEQGHRKVEPFIKIDTESIKYLPDRKVEMLLERYRLRRRTSPREFSKDLEEEICYIFREYEIRKRRKLAHQDYLKKNGLRRAKQHTNRV